MYKIQLSSLAKDDLLNLKKYLGGEFDENIANEMIPKMTVSFRNLEEYPLIGRSLTHLWIVPADMPYSLSRTTKVRLVQ